MNHTFRAHAQAELGDTVIRLDALSQSGFGAVAAIAKRALQGLEAPDGTTPPGNPGDGSARDLMRSRAVRQRHQRPSGGSGLQLGGQARNCAGFQARYARTRDSVRVAQPSARTRAGLVTSGGSVARTAGYMVATWTPETTEPNLAGWAKSLITLVPEKGVEPSTFSLRMSCSTN